MGVVTVVVGVVLVPVVVVTGVTVAHTIPLSFLASAAKWNHARGMDSEERFAAAADGTRLYWRSTGEGEPTVVLTDGIGCAGYIWRRLEPDLARRRRVLRWNFRGHGRSEAPRDPERVTVFDSVDDLFTVMDAAGARTAVLVGHSMGVQVILEAHRRAPERVTALVLALGSPGRPLDTFHGSAVMKRIFPFLRELVLANPDLARRAFETVLPTRFALEFGRWVEVNRQLLPPDDLRRYLDDLAGIDPAIFVRTLTSAAEHDTTDHLPDVRVPTLVIAGERDTFTPMALSERMHSLIPGAELLVLPAGTHTGLLEHPELVALRLEKFFAERVAPARRPRVRRAPKAAGAGKLAPVKAGTGSQG
jgi:pimeloyl-ACP methyl ester carboxylesterase